MSMESAFLTYATKRIAYLNGSIDAMEAGTFWTSEKGADGEEVDTTGQTLGAYRAEPSVKRWQGSRTRLRLAKAPNLLGFQ